MKGRSESQLFIPLLFAAFCLGLMWGCTDKSLPGTISPSSSESEITDEQLDLDDGDQLNKDKDEFCFGTRSKMMSTKKKADRLDFCGHGITAPRGSLQDSMEMSITIVDPGQAEVEFGSDGWFEKPIEIKVSYDTVDLQGIDESTLSLSWLDEATGKWIEVAGVVDTARNHIDAKVWHFTRYALSRR